jgi:hypothetical protein
MPSSVNAQVLGDASPRRHEGHEGQLWLRHVSVERQVDRTIIVEVKSVEKIIKEMLRDGVRRILNG